MSTRVSQATRAERPHNNGHNSTGRLWFTYAIRRYV